jgi:hypothetical protein
MHSIVVEKFESSLITDEMISDAAKLFSSNYGVWGSVAAEKMGAWAKQGELVFSCTPGTFKGERAI